MMWLRANGCFQFDATWLRFTTETQADRQAGRVGDRQSGRQTGRQTVIDISINFNDAIKFTYIYVTNVHI